MKTKFVFIIITLGFFSMNAFAQSKSTAPAFSQLVALSWEINVPAGDKQPITETSLGGFRFEYRKFFSEKFSAGFGISLSSVDQYFPTETYEKPDGSVAVTTDMVRQALNLPMTLTAHYYLGDLSILKPYVGVGLGAQYSTQDIFYNIYVIDHSDWGFVARPEVGALINFGDNVAGIASVGYNYSTNKLDAFKISSMAQVAFNVGLAFKVD